MTVCHAGGYSPYWRHDATLYTVTKPTTCCHIQALYNKIRQRMYGNQIKICLLKIIFQALHKLRL